MIYAKGIFDMIWADLDPICHVEVVNLSTKLSEDKIG